MRIAFLCLALAATAGCVKQRNLTAEEIPKVTTLEDLMDVQSTVADPQMKKAGQASYADADWTAFADAGSRLQVTSAKIKDFTIGAEFDALAVQLNAKAKALADAAQAKDVAAASKALAEMKDTCRTCHTQFKKAYRTQHKS
jgi:cytochrome c556